MPSSLFSTIGLKPTTRRAVEKKAKRLGRTPPEYVRELIERDLLAGLSFDEMLAPVRADVRRSGLTETELDGIVSRARKATSRKPRRSSR